MMLPAFNITTKEIEMLNVSDVSYILKENGVIKYHTSNGEYHPITTLEQHRELLEDYGFVKTDTNSIIQLNKVKKIDEDTQKATLVDGNEVAVSKVSLEKIMKALKLE
ncbi:LytTR family DNA-binding domain-containing protein [Brevibacillus brevis]|uniref:LytTR family DNA-binding domain-containing protein n=1 Tax=Brevibacillus brevis TaxID=1393 RepID=UPI0007D8BA5F|nr:LytTR family DNA-binding domain-containing protein [Brevibacillus brevis]